MSELGPWLREARQARGLSLKQVEAETRIRIKFLAALEEGNYTDLPAEVYAKGFLRNYALFLGLDPVEALEKYKKRDANGQSSEPSLFRPLEVVLFRATNGRLRGWLVPLVLIAGLFVVGLWAWRTGRLAWPPPLTLFRPTATLTTTPMPGQAPTSTLQPSTADLAQATTTTEAATTSGPSLTPRSTLTPGALPGLTSTPVVGPTEPLTPTATITTIFSPTLAASAGVTVAMTVTEQCWVEVTLDGVSDFRGMLNAGDERAWQAQREIILRLGNAGGAQVTVNGEFLGTLGERQQVVEFTWGPEGEVTPAPIATASPEGTFEIREVPTP
jgi:cytoskeleton protein RodZ